MNKNFLLISLVIGVADSIKAASSELPVFLSRTQVGGFLCEAASEVNRAVAEAECAQKQLALYKEEAEIALAKAAQLAKEVEQLRLENRGLLEHADDQEDALNFDEKRIHALQQNVADLKKMNSKKDKDLEELDQQEYVSVKPVCSAVAFVELKETKEALEKLLKEKKVVVRSLREGSLDCTHFAGRYRKDGVWVQYAFSSDELCDE